MRLVQAPTPSLLFLMRSLLNREEIRRRLPPHFIPFSPYFLLSSNRWSFPFPRLLGRIRV